MGLEDSLADGVRSGPTRIPSTPEQRVPLVTGRTVRYANLDAAATTAPSLHVERVVETVMPWYGSVNRGAGFASLISSDAYESARAAVGDFVGAGEEDHVIFTRNTTDAFNLLQRTLPSGTVVLTFLSEHHANLLPWRRGSVRQLPVPLSADQAVGVLERALAELRTDAVLVSVTGASNVTGELWPIAELADVAHRHGARIAVDAAQLAPHRPIDMRAASIDYLALSGHKLYAPYGAGALVGRSDWLDAAPPYLAGGGATGHVSAEEVVWKTGPARHEGGTPLFVGAVALAASCEELQRVGWPAIIEHEAALVERLLAGLRGIDAVETYRLWPEASERIGVVCFNLSGIEPSLVAAALAAEHGIAIRHGAFCAHPLMQELAPAHGSAAARASVGLQTSAEDVDRLLEALAQIATDGPAWRYERRAGVLEPVPDPRPRPWPSGHLPRPSGRTADQLGGSR